MQPLLGDSDFHTDIRDSTRLSGSNFLQNLGNQYKIHLCTIFNNKIFAHQLVIDAI